MGARNLWSEQPLAPPAEKVITELEFLVDLPMWSLVDQQDERKKLQKERKEEERAVNINQK